MWLSLVSGRTLIWFVNEPKDGPAHKEGACRPDGQIRWDPPKSLEPRRKKEGHEGARKGDCGEKSDEGECRHHYAVDHCPFLLHTEETFRCVCGLKPGSIHVYYNRLK